MDFEFPAGRRSIALTVVAGSDPFGEAVVAQVKELLNLLPDSASLAIRLTTAKAVDLAEELRRARAELTQATTVEKIERAGWSVEGRDLDRVAVQHLLVADVQQANMLADQFGAVQRQHPADTVRVLLRCNSGRELLERWPLPEEVAPPVVLLSPHLSSGLNITDEELTGGLAATILMNLLPDMASRLSQPPGSVEASGFAGYYGLGGATIRRVAQHVAALLVRLHSSSESVSRGTEPEPEGITRFLADWSPRALGLRLFDPRLLSELRPEPIPAKPEWGDDGTLLVRLDRAAAAVSLPRRSLRDWSNAIRKISRAFDMSRAFVWRQQLQRASAALSGTVMQEVVGQFRELLATVPLAPAWCDRVLRSLADRVDEKRHALPDTTGDFEQSLAALDAAVAARPNSFVLAARQVLWLVPALVAGIAILHALYPPGRATLFSTLLAVVGIAGAGFAVLRRLWSAHKVVMEARDRAIDIVTSRQEAILSQNTVAYLDDVVVALRQSLKQCRADLEQCGKLLGDIQATLSGAIAVDLPDKPPLAPVLARPAEFEVLVGRLGVPEARWLTEAVQGGLFKGLHDPTLNGMGWCERLLVWCENRLAAGEGVRLPGYGELWGIRRAVRHEQDLAAATTALWNRAAPMTDAVLAAGASSFIMVPTELAADVRAAAAGSGLHVDEVVETRSVPLVCCVRKGQLRIQKRIAR